MKTKMRILVVEDESRMAELLRQCLDEEGHAVSVAFDGTTGLRMAEAGPFDLLVLDILLPGLDGLNVARRLRQARNRTPILLLTARDSTHDIVTGLDAGADDYLTKPFSVEVLLARVRALGRRGPIAQPIRFEVADLVLDQGARTVARGGRPVALTRTEYAILELLMRNAGRVVTRETLLESIWGGESDVESNTLDAFLRLLRTKVEAPGEAKLIHTVRGFGYMLRVEAP